MNEIALHIEFLLHKHDCVIVPGLGGFVVNQTEMERAGLWGINIPKYELIFNHKLSYNDGLLAESLMRTDEVSYDVAIKKIEEACQNLKRNLNEKNDVIWHNIGAFSYNNEGNIVLTPDKTFTRLQFFGLTDVRLKPASLKFTQTATNDNLISVKSFFQYVSSAVAVALILFLGVISFNNNHPQSQQAEMVSKPLIFNAPKTSQNISHTTQSSAIITTTTTSDAVEDSEKQHDDQTSITPSSSDKMDIDGATKTIQPDTDKYYIIVGVYEVREIAEKALKTLKVNGFNDASMIERPLRLDVYSAAFSNRREAQAYLKEFKAKHTRYRDAWILKR